MRSPRLALLLLLAVSCDSPAKPTPPPSCQTNTTATVNFRNVGSQPVDVLWNGAVMATSLAPGATAGPFTVTAGGAQYNLEMRFAGTQTPACGVLIATPVQCQLNQYTSCNF